MTTETGTSRLTAEIVNVPLANGPPIQCDLTDFNALMLAGYSDQFWSHSNGGRGPTRRERFYMRTTRPDTPGETYVVARLIMGCGPRERIRYDDGNSRNLRRSNLVVVAPPVEPEDDAAL